MIGHTQIRCRILEVVHMVQLMASEVTSPDLDPLSANCGVAEIANHVQWRLRLEAVSARRWWV